MAIFCAVNNGSGRKPIESKIIPSNIEVAENKNGPEFSGKPRKLPNCAPGRTRFGPATAPRVVAQTTIAKSRPRCSLAARSAAAKRDCKFSVVLKPKPAAATSTEGKLLVAAATTINTAPAKATVRQRLSETLRPRFRAKEAMGIAENAAASVSNVVTDPAQASEPLRSTASNEPAAKTPTVRR
ncbi:transporter, MFS superfamily [Renibacterium salmoninarum ATCC 33209]|uniref:Transporter, MFS superfamily n=1 Tax=Renibacterium salmoninarum (strain ATCC 33209 / DSM 20767 / JCM 11484 / NBRC 15589 / NCIMB 2235) TaxID=288705 RepID=A9WT83_RENSM|nr:transporter, MFS superfamily [Renibacterium salmoninarum ATCC 33209]